jgi:TIR domain
MNKIFISYRRDDAGDAAGRLSDHLTECFGRDSVFMDVDGIALGRDFREVIDETLGQCGVMLAVMGKTWLQNTDAKGNRRIDQPGDFVRLEIGTALKRDIPVIPVRVQGAGIPSQNDLPDDLKDFAFRNAIELSQDRWRSDVQNLTEKLRPLMGELTPQPQAPPVSSHVPPPPVPDEQQQTLTGAIPQKKSSKQSVKWYLVGSAFLLIGLILILHFVPTSNNPATERPIISEVSTIQPGRKQIIKIVGSGFGTYASYRGDSPFIKISDVTQNWNAGNSSNGDSNSVTLNIGSWTDTEIRIHGFTGAYGQNNWILNEGDEVIVSVTNPQTGAGPSSCTVTVGSASSRCAER